jgi:hypothetical protein
MAVIQPNINSLLKQVSIACSDLSVRTISFLFYDHFDAEST